MDESTIIRMAWTALIVLLIASAVMILLMTRAYYLNKKWLARNRTLDDMEDIYKRLLKTQHAIVNSMISRLGIEEAIEALQDAGYQISPDETSDTKYVLYDPDGGEIELEFKKI